MLFRLLEFCGFGRIDPPQDALAEAGGVVVDLVARQLLRMVENVPVGDGVTGPVPLRHPVTPGAEYAIEGVAGDREVGAVFGAENLFDQRVDDGTGDTGEIV